MAWDEGLTRSVVDAVLAGWKEHGVPWLPGVEPAEIAAFETRNGVTLPSDLRLFYERTNGTSVPLYPGDDHRNYEFYELSRVVPDERDPWVWNFADYLLISWLFGIDLAGNGPYGKSAVYLVGGREPAIVARSFTEFLQLYLADDQRLTPPGALAYANKTARSRRAGCLTNASSVVAIAVILITVLAACTPPHGERSSTTASAAPQAASARPAPADPDLATVMERFYQQVEGGHWRFADAMLSPRLRAQLGENGLRSRYEAIANLAVTLRQRNARTVVTSVTGTDRADRSRSVRVEETVTLTWDGEQWTIDAITPRSLSPGTR
jgi:SMI1 / KNR4 family (SUKH-1)